MMCSRSSIFVAIVLFIFFFFLNVSAPPEIYTLSLHDALPISLRGVRRSPRWPGTRLLPSAGEPHSAKLVVRLPPPRPARERSLQLSVRLCAVSGGGARAALGVPARACDRQHAPLRLLLRRARWRRRH